MADWHPGYWIVFGLLVAAIVYELWAVYTQVRRRRTGKAAWPTITESVRRLDRKWRWTGILGTIVGAILILHFWWGLW